ncbi:MAG TPA: DUF1385 domain-containing protein [Firmicutes bacterium]|nr:DUF1385 domain-containing protein [Bacillota bacterium]
MKNCKRTTIGGQALIEAIMMKGPEKTAIAVRMPDGSISVEYMQEKRWNQKNRFLRLPLIRGAVGLIESLVSGYKAMMYAAEKSGFADMEEEEEREKREAKERKKAEKKARKAGMHNLQAASPLPDPAVGRPLEETAAMDAAPAAGQTAADGAAPAAEQALPRQEKKKEEKEESAFMGLLMGVASVLGVALALFLFMWLPTFIFNGINHLTGDAISNWRSLIEGVMKMGIFVGYLALVSLMKDIKRVFMYHGAEHKSIFCYEAGEELTVENVRKQRRFHPRCGTSFMILMLIVSIIVAAILSIAFPILTKYTAIWVAIKILMLPIICGLGYELIRFCGRHDNILTKIISAPGMWLQRLTTKEPDDSMIEVGIASLKAVIPSDPDADNW